MSANLRIGAALCLTAVVTAGCTFFDLDSLVTKAVVLDATSSFGVRPCNYSNDAAAKTKQVLSVPKPSRVANSVGSVMSSLPPEIQSLSVISAALSMTQYNSAQTFKTAYEQLGWTIPNEETDYLSKLTKPRTLISALDIQTLGKTTATQIQRQTGSPASGGNTSQGSQFWNRLKGYYYTYYSGGFVDYFDTSLNSVPKSLTVTDTEIVQAVTVFFEMIFDDVMQTPVWIDSNGKYYPGGTKNKPTSVALNYLTVQQPPIPATFTGCGMNTYKANTIKYLAQIFATAASTETGLTIKTAGGLQIGLGILGKVNIGDNSTLTMLLQGIFGEIVKRVTAEVTYPILASLDFYDNGSSQSNAQPSKPKKAAQSGSEPEYTGSIPNATKAAIPDAVVRRHIPTDVWISRMSSPFVGVGGS